MMDLNFNNAKQQFTIEEAIRNIIFYLLNTPYNSRIFNPRKGSLIHTLLYETRDSIVRDMHLSALLVSAVSSALPGADVSLTVSYESDGRGAQTMYIKFLIEYQESEYNLTYSPTEKRFTN